MDLLARKQLAFFCFSIIISENHSLKVFLKFLYLISVVIDVGVITVYTKENSMRKYGYSVN
jgi:hypothetical protein